MDDELLAYFTGRDDGIAGKRNDEHTGHPATGADYRIGFIDGRIALFHIHSQLRRLLSEDAD